jgi:hypothetical protein
VEKDRLKDPKPNQTQSLLIMAPMHDCDVVIALLDSLYDGSEYTMTVQMQMHR